MGLEVTILKLSPDDGDTVASEDEGWAKKGGTLYGITVLTPSYFRDSWRSSRRGALLSWTEFYHIILIKFIVRDL